MHDACRLAAEIRDATLSVRYTAQASLLLQFLRTKPSFLRTYYSYRIYTHFMPDLSERSLMWQRNVNVSFINNDNKMAPRRSNEETDGNEHPGNNGEVRGNHIRLLYNDNASSNAVRLSQQQQRDGNEVVLVSSESSEHRTLVCTALSKDIQVKLEELEVLTNNLVSPSESAGYEVSRRRQLLAGGTVLMDRRDDDLRDESDGLEFLELEEHVWLLLWLVLGPQRLQHLTKGERDEEGEKMIWERGGAKLVWRALQLCCSARGAKSASAVPLSPEHNCDMACLRDHASRMLEVCAPTRELWRTFGWAGLTVDAVLHKILREDVLPHIALLPAVPIEIASSLRRIETYQTMLKQLNTTQQNRHPSEGESCTETHEVNHLVVRRKRGRPAKSPAASRREPGRLERVFLWRFLLELLEDTRLVGCLRWVQRDDGIFRILNTDMLARLWGRRHGNPRMTYEKMARAMRTYYRSRVLLPVPRARNLPRKLVYRFAPSILQKLTADLQNRSNVTVAAAKSVPTHSNLLPLS